MPNITNAEYLPVELQDWICNNPTKQELRFLNNESDVTSDDSCDISDPTKCNRYNQLTSLGKTVSKLLHSTKPKFNKCWRKPGEELNFEENYSANITRFDQPFITSSDDSDSNTSYLSQKKTIRNKVGQSSSENNILVNSSGFLDVEECNSETESESLRKMAKSHKRKREDSVSNEEESNVSKKVKHSDNQTQEKSKRKEKNHDVSLSGSELSDGHFTAPAEGLRPLVNKPNRNSFNTHLLSSESELDTETNEVLTSKRSSHYGDVNGISKQEPSNNLYGANADVEVTVAESVIENSREHLRVPKFSQQLSDEISQFSALLDDNIVENNDIWILQCPNDMDCSALVSQRLNLGGSSTLDDGRKVYEAYSYRNASTRPATLAVPNKHNRLHLQRIPISGNIIVEESIKSVKKPRSNNLIPESPSKVEFPGNLRTRHPLLGIDFSKQPRTVGRVAPSSSKKKRRSKKFNESFNGHSDQPMDESIDFSPKKKKKKKKQKDNDSFN